MRKLKWMKRGGVSVGCVLMGMLAAGLVSTRVQARQTTGTGIGTGGIPQAQSGNPSLHGEDPIDSVSAARQQEMRARQAMDDRHKRMVDDADKLLELVTELKSDVDKSTKYETSAAAIKKAADIEKLAHDLRERMRN